MKGLRRVLLSIALVMLLASPAVATTYYVAKTGSDAVSCAIAQVITTPKRTIAGGVGCLSAGDTLYIRSGTYVENIQSDFMPASGTANARITIARYQNEVVTMAPGGSSAFVVWMNNTNGAKSYITFDGIIMDGTSTLAAPSYPAVIYLTGGDHNIFQNLEIKNSPGNGVLGGGTDHKFLNNVIHDNGLSLNYSKSNGMYLDLLTFSLVQGNVLYNNECGGIRVYESDGTQGSAHDNLFDRNYSHDNGAIGRGIGGVNCDSLGAGYIIGNQNNTFTNNLAINNTGRGFAFFKESTANANDHNALYNNTAYGNTVGGIEVISSAITNTQLINNLVVGNTSFQILNNGTSTTQTTNRTTGLITDCTLSATDFHLKVGAPCIDVGTTLASVTTDKDGVTRPQGSAWDIGAYEFAASDTTPPTAPGSLVATATSPTVVGISWTASTDAVGVTAYLLDRCTGPAVCSPYSALTTVTGVTYTDTGLTPSTVYWYRARAQDAAGNLSAYSNIDPATTFVLDTTAPAAPTGVTVQ